MHLSTMTQTQIGYGGVIRRKCEHIAARAHVVVGQCWWLHTTTPTRLARTVWSVNRRCDACSCGDVWPCWQLWHTRDIWLSVLPTTYCLCVRKSKPPLLIGAWGGGELLGAYRHRDANTDRLWWHY